ncbi:hypothetical protein FRC00_002187 [Tulasnella sp. 408]|nr:hypothetical protein FRC00_002187 [Tulasnella sp. 408]
MLKLFTRVGQQTRTPSPSTPQSSLEKRLAPSSLSLTPKKKPVVTATYQRSSNAVKESTLTRPSKQNTMQQPTKPTESTVFRPPASGQPSTRAAAQRRREAQPPAGTFLTDQPSTIATELEPPSEVGTAPRSERTRSSPWAPRNPLSTTESSNSVGISISLRTGRATWSRRRPIWATAAMQTSSTPATPAVSLRTGRAIWSPQQPALAIAPFESSASPVIPPVSLRTGMATWSPRQPASDNTSVESPASPATPPASLRTGRARWSPRQALPDSFWAKGSLWSYRKPGGCPKAPPSSRTSSCNTDCKTGDRRFSSQTALYEYVSTTIDFDWIGEAEKLNREARRLELLHALEPAFQEQGRRSST